MLEENFYTRIERDRISAALSVFSEDHRQLGRMNIDRVSESTCQQPISGEYVKKRRIHRGQYSVKIECKVFAAPALGAIGVASIGGWFDVYDVPAT